MKDNEMFNQMADYYDRFRPEYPQNVIQKIVDAACLTSTSRVLEIGAGSGKATSRLIDYGFDIVCIEPSADLASKGMKRFSVRPVEYIISSFEACALPDHAFDAIIAAQSFHWIKKPDGYRLSSQYLKDNGFLLPFWNIEIIRDSEIDREVFDIIQRYDAYTTVLREEDYWKRSRSLCDEMRDSGYFVQPEVFRLEWTHNFSAEAYFGYFMTGSRFIQNTADRKAACLTELNALEGKYGHIARTFISELYIAKKIT